MATEAGGFNALRSAFDHFSATLDATTVPAEGGGRRVGGIAHAAALSEAADALYDQLAAAYRRLMPTPGTGVFAKRIGGGGADAVLLAALESAAKAVAFPIAKWNAMQAARPGANHQRFHAGEVVSAADLAALESAAKLLRLKAPPVTPTTKALPARTEVVLWEGAAHTERNIRLARTRSAYLEAHGDVSAAMAALTAGGNAIGKSTFYDHLNALDRECPGWRADVLVSGASGNPESGAIVRMRGKSRAKSG